jgi:phosphatidyl-myo-inositol dimannoside synthase
VTPVARPSPVVAPIALCTSVRLMPDAVMVTSSFLPGRGGIESYLAELCSLVAPRIAVLGPRKRDEIPIPQDLGYPAHGYEDGAMLVPSRKVVRAISNLAARYHTTKVIFGTPWPLGLRGPDLTRRGLRYVVIVHGAELLVPAAVPGLRRRLAKALAGADLLLPVSAYTGDALRELIEDHDLPVPPIERLRARVNLDRFHPGVDAGSLRTRLGLLPDDKVVLCLGRLVKRKGVDRLVASWDSSRNLPEGARGGSSSPVASRMPMRPPTSPLQTYSPFQSRTGTSDSRSKGWAWFCSRRPPLESPA